ncbi:MAG: isoprenylcysteine carboxylmethyltransferase family protein [Clostridia bacterium]|nr:isoprenylcysteine carboxylmethyltransferase family protein [Clostridia bacterium]
MEKFVFLCYHISAIFNPQSLFGRINLLQKEQIMSHRALSLIAYTSVAVFSGILLGLIFGAAGSWQYAAGWAFWVSFCVPTLMITAFFLKEDPALIERRIFPVETRPRQLIGQGIAGVLFAALMILPALDYRNGWSRLPLAVSLAGDAMVIIGFVIVFFVFRENTFASRAVEIMHHQQVIQTGPYAVVRHPMYLGALMVILAMPFALGSLLGVFIALPLMGVIVCRILDEEKLLRAELDGYSDYCRKTKYRLIPYVW